MAAPLPAGALHADLCSATLEDAETTGNGRHFGWHPGGEIWYFSARTDLPAKPTAMGADLLAFVHLLPEPQPQAFLHSALGLECCWAFGCCPGARSIVDAAVLLSGSQPACAMA